MKLPVIPDWVLAAVGETGAEAMAFGSPKSAGGSTVLPVRLGDTPLASHVCLGS